MSDENKKAIQQGMEEAGQPDIEIETPETDKMLLKRLAEKDAEIARMKKTTVSKEQYNELVASIADGQFMPEQPEPEDDEPTTTIAEDVEQLFKIGDKSVRNRIGNREATRRQVELVRRIKAEKGENLLVASGSQIDTESKAERWLNLMEDALSKSTNDAQFEAYFKQMRGHR